MVDPRTSIVNERLKGIRRVIAVSSGKGGVGKSLFASTFALILAKKGFKVGLFDLDFTSPSSHTILGVQELRLREEKGIIPAQLHGLEYMSIIFYSGDHVTSLRGADVSNALIELLSIVIWGKLDYLILDMPPGIGDATLDLIRLIERIEFLIVTTPSKLSFETVKRLTKLLQTLKVRVIGVVENMEFAHSDTIQQETKTLGLAFIGKIPFDTGIEETIGKTDKLLDTVFAEKVKQFALKI
ncbi:MAG TPA: ATP-binding protein [candidate division Zixibacteria bacterium]|nr:ATP-binding protein [candidate division Zixibacteria bacterium]